MKHKLLYLDISHEFNFVICVWVKCNKTYTRRKTKESRFTCYNKLNLIVWYINTFSEIMPCMFYKL